MKALLLGAVSLLSLIACGGNSGDTTELGFGFRKVVRSEEAPADHWEGIGHFEFLYYKYKNLGQTSSYSISPEGNYALYQDAPTGNIVLFYPKQNKKKVVIPYNDKMANKYIWDVSRNTATVEFYSGDPEKVRLDAAP